MDDKRFVGVYYSESELISKVDELKGQGVADDNIYVVAKNDTDLSMLRSRTSAEVQTTEHESWLDRFMDFITGKDHVHGMLHHLGLDDDEADRYYRDIENGGMLLYVDEGEASTYYTDNERDFTGDAAAFDTGMPSSTELGMGSGTAADPNLGANMVGVNDEATNDAGVGNQYRDSLNNEETYGRVGGEAVLDRTDYETPPSNQYGRNGNEEERMRLHEERLNVDKEKREAGEVSLEKDVVEEQQSFDVPVMREEVYVERRPVNEEASGMEAKFTEEDDTIRIPVTEERLEVTKKPVVSEEIVVGKRQVEDTETVNETVRREEAHIDKDGNVDVTGDFKNQSSDGFYDSQKDDWNSPRNSLDSTTQSWNNGQAGSTRNSLDSSETAWNTDRNFFGSSDTSWSSTNNPTNEASSFRQPEMGATVNDPINTTPDKPLGQAPEDMSDALTDSTLETRNNLTDATGLNTKPMDDDELNR